MHLFLQIIINYLQMLLNLHKKTWMEGLKLQDYNDHCTVNGQLVDSMLQLAKNYHKVILLVDSFAVILEQLVMLLSYTVQ